MHFLFFYLFFNFYVITLKRNGVSRSQGFRGNVPVVTGQSSA
uniref:Uncharacterized protein n=1 Tax=Arundo donax TaxID=35708 RepID=A0A0A8YRJ4_ARUDO